MRQIDLEILHSVTILAGEPVSDKPGPNAADEVFWAGEVKRRR